MLSPCFVFFINLLTTPTIEVGGSTITGSGCATLGTQTRFEASAIGWDNDGVTPLLSALTEGHEAVAQLLRDAGGVDGLDESL